MINNQLISESIQSLPKSPTSDQIYVAHRGFYVYKYEVQHQTYGLITKYVYYGSEYGRRTNEFSREYVLQVQDTMVTLRVDQVWKHQYQAQRGFVKIEVDDSRPVPQGQVNWDIIKRNGIHYERAIAMSDKKLKKEFLDTCSAADTKELTDVLSQITQQSKLGRELISKGVDANNLNLAGLYYENIERESLKEQYFQAEIYEGTSTGTSTDTRAQVQENLVGKLKVHRNYAISDSKIEYTVESATGTESRSSSVELSPNAKSNEFMRSVTVPYFRGTLKLTADSFTPHDLENTFYRAVYSDKFNAVDYSGLFPGQRVKLKDLKVTFAIISTTYEDMGGGEEYYIIQRIYADNNDNTLSIQYDVTDINYTEEVFFDKNRNIIKTTVRTGGQTVEIPTPVLHYKYQDKFYEEPIEIIMAKWTAEVVEDLGNNQNGAKVADLSALFLPSSFDAQTVIGDITIAKTDSSRYVAYYFQLPPDFSMNQVSFDGTPGDDYAVQPIFTADDVLYDFRHDLLD